MEEDKIEEFVKNNIDIKSDIINNKHEALQKLDSILNGYLENPNMIDKADKLSYWIKDYCSLIKFEKEFNPRYLKRYERGDIIKVNLRI